VKLKIVISYWEGEIGRGSRTEPWGTPVKSKTSAVMRLSTVNMLAGNWENLRAVLGFIISVHIIKNLKASKDCSQCKVMKWITDCIKSLFSLIKQSTLLTLKQKLKLKTMCKQWRSPKCKMLSTSLQTRRLLIVLFHILIQTVNTDDGSKGAVIMFLYLLIYCYDVGRCSEWFLGHCYCSVC